MSDCTYPTKIDYALKPEEVMYFKMFKEHTGNIKYVLRCVNFNDPDGDLIINCEFTDMMYEDMGVNPSELDCVRDVVKNDVTRYQLTRMLETVLEQLNDTSPTSKTEGDETQ